MVVVVLLKVIVWWYHLAIVMVAIVVDYYYDDDIGKVRLYFYQSIWGEKSNKIKKLDDRSDSLTFISPNS